MSSLEELLGLTADSPSQRRADFLVESDAGLLRDLIALRKSLGLTQAEVAATMGVTQPTVAAFEAYDNDPKLSSVRRYAHSIGALVIHRVDRDRGGMYDTHDSAWQSASVHVTNRVVKKPRSRIDRKLMPVPNVA